MSDEQVSQETQEPNVPLGLRAIHLASEEMLGLYQELAVVEWLCKAMHDLLLGDPKDMNWDARVAEAFAVYDQMYPCCEDCAETGGNCD